MILFLAILFFAAVLSRDFFSAAALGTLFYLVLGAKDIILIRRAEAYEAAVIILILLAFLVAFSHVERWNEKMPFLWLMIPAIFVFFLLRSFLRYRHQFYGSDNSFNIKKAEVIAALISFVVWQLSIALIFLPIDFLHQTAALFLFAVVSLEFLIDETFGTLSKKRTFFYFASFFIMAVAILASAYS